MMLPLATPIILPLMAAALCLVAWGSRPIQRTVAIASAFLNLIAAIVIFRSVWVTGIRVEHIGAWAPPFGISLVADLLGALMVLLTAMSAALVTVYSLGSIHPGRESYGYYPLFNILIMGVNGAFLTGDLFNLYVWFEVLLMASFALLALGGERHQLDGTIKYLTLNLISSALFLAGLGILYGVVGTLNMADLADKLSRVENTGLLSTVAVFFLIAFGIKAGLFPLFSWLPASYHAPPIAVSAIFAGLLTKVGIYALIRTFTLIFFEGVGVSFSVLLLTLAGFTMITGVLGAIAHNELPRILSFQIIASTGFMIMGLGLLTPLALTGMVFYIIHSVIGMTSLFLVAGIVRRSRGSYYLDHVGGIYASNVWLSLFFIIPALSLAGVPPFPGFFAKLPLLLAALETKSYFLVTILVVTSLLTLYSMTKIWSRAFWEPESLEHGDNGADSSGYEGGRWAFMIAPVIVLTLAILVLGLGAEPVMAFSARVSEQLLDPSIYIRAVLGGGT